MNQTQHATRGTEPLPLAPTPDEVGRKPAPRTSYLTTAAVAGAFCLLVCAALIYEHFQARPIDLLQAEAIQNLKEKLRAAPANEELKQQIREADLKLRNRFFHQLALTRSGGWLLFAGLLAFLISAKRATTYRKRLPMPQPKPEAANEQALATAWMRRSVAGVGIVAGAVCLTLILSVGTSLPDRLNDIDKLSGATTHVPAAEGPSLTEIQANWPQFRGPFGSGISTHTNAPLLWDWKTGAGIGWKTAVSAPGFNSPVVWGNRVFVSGGDKSKREVFCFSTTTGEILWQCPVENAPGSPVEMPEIPAEPGFAASTMAVDGRRAYVMFANGDLAAFDLNGKLAWAKSVGPIKNQYGHAASLVLWQGKLILQLDQGESEDRKSKLFVFDSATGQILWQRPRPVPSSWASPIAIEAAGQPQIIALGIPWVISYSASDGTELWRAECLGGEVTPSPIFAGGMLYVISPSEKLLAIKPDGRGDVTKTHIAWTADENIPDVVSPVSNGELVFTMTTPGQLTCFDAKDGKKQWEHDFGFDFQASPTLVGNRLFAVSVKGTAVVVEAARQFKELARSAREEAGTKPARRAGKSAGPDTESAEEFLASPAFLPDRIFLRSTKSLYCIGPKDEKLPTSRPTNTNTAY